jgi:hypothetical protein
MQLPSSILSTEEPRVTRPPPISYFHMSGDIYAPDQLIVANGKEKLPDEFEGPLEKYRPIHHQPRRGFVYCRPDKDFSRCGIVNAKYIYRVDPEGVVPQIHDLAWIGDMQMALLKEKYPGKFNRFPDWSEELVQSCCEGYWSDASTASPVWEYLFPSVRVVEVVSHQLIAPSATKGGWPP